MNHLSVVYRASSVLLLFGAVHACDSQADPTYQGEPLTTLKGRLGVRSGTPEAADVGVLWLADAEGTCTGPEQSCAVSSSGSFSASVDQTCIDACGEMPDCFDADKVEGWVSCQNACGSDVEVHVRAEYHACFSGGVGQTAPVVGDFPAQFSLDVLSPPPSEALLRSDTGERVALGYIVAILPDSGPLVLGREEDPPPWLLGGSESHVLVYAEEPIAADSSWGIYLGGAYAPGYHLIEVIFGNRCGLPRLDAYDDPDSESDMVPMSDGAPANDTTPPSSEELPPSPALDEPDYRGVPLVCGNGVCEENENCDVCSDCTACEGSSPGVSTNQSNREGEYHCIATAGSLRPVPAGNAAEIELLIAPARLIDWPSL
jgi:hypothetical protein